MKHHRAAYGYFGPWPNGSMAVMQGGDRKHWIYYPPGTWEMVGGWHHMHGVYVVEPGDPYYLTDMHFGFGLAMRV